MPFTLVILNDTSHMLIIRTTRCKHETTTTQRSLRKAQNYSASHLLIEAQQHIYASVNWVIIGSSNGLLPVWHQAII